MEPVKQPDSVTAECGAQEAKNERFSTPQASSRVEVRHQFIRMGFSEEVVGWSAEVLVGRR